MQLGLVNSFQPIQHMRHVYTATIQSDFSLDKPIPTEHTMLIKKIPNTVDCLHEKEDRNLLKAA